MTQPIHARISQIRTQAAEFGPMLDGCLQTKRNKVVNKDGGTHTSPMHYQFQYRGADGKTHWKSIPPGYCAQIRRLVARGREYKLLERKYAALVNEATLAEVGKKNAAH